MEGLKEEEGNNVYDQNNDLELIINHTSKPSLSPLLSKSSHSLNKNSVFF
jgi:hypothetical protein